MAEVTATGAAGGYPVPAEKAPPHHHPLLAKGNFDLLQSNDCIEARPSVLHFGGFQLHKDHSQTLRIVNTSPASFRVSILPPSTPYFRVNFDKKGLLAPGMSEDVTITFTPHEWRYYHDSVKIFCGGQSENLLVPIHAYPAVSDIAIPRFIDFGCVSIGATKAKRIPLTCRIPIRFEYEIVILENNPDFQVSPTSGDIPPHGSSEVLITFAPTRHRTARLELEFRLSQFDFQPITVSIVGSSAPDVTRHQLVASAEQERAAVEAEEHQQAVTKQLDKMAARRNKKKGQLEVKPPSFPVPELEREVDGVKVLTARFDPHATAFVLNQAPGKLPLKDLGNFIREQREGLKTLQREQEKKVKKDAEGNSGKPALTEMTRDDDAGEDRQALELRFEMHYRDVEKFDREKELKSLPAVGEEEPHSEELATLLQARQATEESFRTRRLGMDVKRVDSVLSKALVPVPGGYRPVGAPTWETNNNDTFTTRLQVIQRFLRAESHLRMRLRAQRRLTLLRKAIRAAGVVDRKSCKAWVEAENKAARAGGLKDTQAQKPTKKTANIAYTGTTTLSSSSKGPSLLQAEAMVADVLEVIGFGPECILPECFPTSPADISSEDRIPVEVEKLGNFDSFRPVKINPRNDFHVYDYPKFAVPPPAAHMKPLTSPGRLRGALEESSIRGAFGAVDDGAETAFAMPESCLLPPADDVMKLLVPSGEARAYVPPPRLTECDAAHRLSMPPPLIRPLQTEALFPPYMELLHTTRLHTWDTRTSLPDPFQHLDPAPASFAPAGGNLGPKLGAHLKGEMLKSLPVGGLDRDLPSDTDDDECDDFLLPPPPEEAFLEADKHLQQPLQCEMWTNMAADEDKLRETFARDGKAVREKFIELNHDLHRRTKLHLG